MTDEFRTIRGEMAAGLEALRSEMREGFARLESRITRLESIVA